MENKKRKSEILKLVFIISIVLVLGCQKSDVNNIQCLKYDDNSLTNLSICHGDLSAIEESIIIDSLNCGKDVKGNWFASHSISFGEVCARNNNKVTLELELTNDQAISDLEIEMMLNHFAWDKQNEHAQGFSVESFSLDSIRHSALSEVSNYYSQKSGCAIKGINDIASKTELGRVTSSYQFIFRLKDNFSNEMELKSYLKTKIKRINLDFEYVALNE